MAVPISPNAHLSLNPLEPPDSDSPIDIHTSSQHSLPAFVATVVSLRKMTPPQKKNLDVIGVSFKVKALTPKRASSLLIDNSGPRMVFVN